MWEACNCNCNIIGLHSGTVLGVLKNLLKRVHMFQIELEHKIFKVFIAWSEKKNMYYPITPKADIHNVTHTVLFYCPINAEIRAPEGQSDQSYSATRCLVFLKEYC